VFCNFFLAIFCGLFCEKFSHSVVDPHAALHTQVNTLGGAEGEGGRGKEWGRGGREWVWDRGLGKEWVRGVEWIRKRYTLIRWHTTIIHHANSIDYTTPRL